MNSETGMASSSCSWAYISSDDARLEHLLQLLPSWVRTAVEVRHPSRQHDQVFDLLQRHGVPTA